MAIASLTSARPGASPGAPQPRPRVGLLRPPDPPAARPYAAWRHRGRDAESLTRAPGGPPSGAPTRRSPYTSGSHRASHDRPGRGWPRAGGAYLGDSENQGSRPRPRSTDVLVLSSLQLHRSVWARVRVYLAGLPHVGQNALWLRSYRLSTTPATTE